MYEIQIDHLIYCKRGGQPFTLAEALAETKGCGNARILRTDGTLAVSNAGSGYAVTHAPTGRTIVRRRARHLTRSAA